MTTGYYERLEGQITNLQDTLDTIRERHGYKQYQPSSYIALDNYINGIDALHESATPHYPVPATIGDVEITDYGQMIVWYTQQIPVFLSTGIKAYSSGRRYGKED